MDDRRELTATRTKLFYGLGSVAFGVKDNGFQTILLPFYNLVLHLPAALVGLAIFIALLVDAFLDPIVGHFSDNLRSRWGRRHPFMYLSAVPVSVSYLLLWNPPALSPGALFVYLIVVAVVVRTFITFYEIPSAALVPELTEDYDTRTSFVAYRVMFAWFGGLTMAVLAFQVFMRKDAAHAVGQLNPIGYSHYGLVAAAVMFVAILVSAAGTHRFIPLFRQPETHHASMGRYVRDMFASLANGPFLILIAAATLFYVSTGVVFALNFYINTFFWRFDNSQIAGLTLATFVAVMLAFAIAPPVSRAFGKKHGSIALFALGLAISITPLSLGLLGVLPAEPSMRNLALLFATATFGGALTIGSSVMLVSMIADVVEDSEIRTGRRSEGLFFAGGSFVQKAASGLGLLVSGLVIGATHFPTTVAPGKIDHAVLWHFAVGYLVTVVALYALGFVVIAFFPIDRARHQANLKKLAGDPNLIDQPPAPMV